MKCTAQIEFEGSLFEADLMRPLDISLPVGPSGVRAWYKGPPVIEPVRGEGFVGAVLQGGSVNFRDISFNPHAHGTHTECRGHITPEVFSVNEVMLQFFFVAQLITVTPEIRGRDRVVTKECLSTECPESVPSALIVRSLPNEESKRTANYSDANFPYFEPEAIRWMVERGVRHLLTDLPSVDPERDGGRLLSHREFWKGDGRDSCTITELIYAESSIRDGLYLLNLQVAAFENDAAPSRPVLFPLSI